MEIQRKDYPQAGFEVYGTGEIGDKAYQLLRKTPLLREIGFDTPQRVVLAQGLFNEFFRQNGLGKDITNAGVGEEVQARIQAAGFPDELRPLLGSLAVRFGDVPVMVRSSAIGDSRGTGIYRSEVADPGNPQIFESVVKRVLASYVSESAHRFRQDANTGEGFAVMVEPMIGERFDRQYYDGEFWFAPPMSGNGYTSTVRGDGYTYFVPGFGSGVDRRDGDRLTGKLLERYEGDFLAFLESVRRAKGTAVISSQHRGFSSDRPIGLAYSPLAFRGLDQELLRVTDDVAGYGIDYMYEDFRFSEFFDMQKKIEDKLGKPQYLEWALTLKGGQRFWALQISNVDYKKDRYDFEDFGIPLLEANIVTGSGIRRYSKIAIPRQVEDIERLYDFNGKNVDYILLYDQGLVSPLGRNGMEYRHYSNAGVFIELGAENHMVSTPVSHIQGQLEEAGKLFGVVNRRGEYSPDWEEVGRNLSRESGIDIYSGDFTVVASSLQDRMVVYR